MASPVEDSKSAGASAPPPASAEPTHDEKEDAPDPQVQQKVHDVLHSDIGINTLLNRLKASIASARVRLSSSLHVPWLTQTGLCCLPEAPRRNRGGARKQSQEAQ